MASPRAPRLADPRARQRILAAALLLVLVVFAARLVFIQGIRSSVLSSEALSSRLTTKELTGRIVTYGEAFGQQEYEMSRYYLDDADVEANRRLYETYVGEATRMVEARLPVPAHSYILKSSHAFNVLDARGAVSVTERVPISVPRMVN